MNILDALEKKGIFPKRTSSTNGGEYASRCPHCGGDDRFRIWPHQGKRGRYWCRQCGTSGDLIQFFRDFENMSFRDACIASGNQDKLDIDKKYAPKSEKRRRSINSDEWKPDGIEYPSYDWLSNATELIEYAQEKLHARRSRCRTWLNKRRCLKNHTIKEWGLGYLPENLFLDRREWGLPSVRDEKTGKKKKLFVPQGLVIPEMWGTNAIRLRIRCNNPGDYSKYYIVPGSTMCPLYEYDRVAKVAVIVESELDAILLSQESKENNLKISSIALGSVTNRPDEDLTNLLRNKMDHILVALDSDPAGTKQSHGFWLRYFPNATRCVIPSKYGKDPTEAMLNGLNLSHWLKAGLSIAKNNNI